jgi:predicted DNA-binding transcriptional regulator AlpA
MSPPPDVVGAAEIAQLLGISRQMVDKLARTDPTFPKSKALATGRIWRRGEVERWARKAGRI